MINIKQSIERWKRARHFYQIPLSVILLAIFFLIIPGSKHSYGGDAKYIILFVGDGWGSKHIEAVNKYTGSTPAYQSSPWVQHWVSTYPAGGSYNTTQAWSDFIYVKSGEPDSACSATAMYTGFKTGTRRLTVSEDASTAYYSIGEKAKDSDMAVGAVSTVPVSHATPGAWVAHNDDRGNTFAIADEGFFGDPNTTGTTSTNWKYAGGHGPTLPPVDVLIGSDGADYVSSQILTKLRNESGQLDKHVLVEKQTGQDGGTNVIAAANDVDTKKLAGLFDHSYCNADGSSCNPENPTLSESTTAALKVLSRNTKGFVLMVEGGAIDWAAHANNMNQMIGEAIDYNQAIQTVIDWVEDPANDADWSNTLVIVTADHECGYLTAGPGVFPNQPLGAVNSSTLAKEKIVSDSGGRRASWDDTNSNDLIDAGEAVYWYWNGGGHTKGLVRLYARGVGSELFDSYAIYNDSVRGPYMDDTDIFSVMYSSIKEQTCTETGEISIIPGQTLYGNPVNLTSIVAANNTMNLSYEVRGATSCEVDPNGTYIEAENFTGTINQGTGTFVAETTQAGYLGTGYLRSNGGIASSTCPSADQGKKYQVNFPTTGTYNVWIRGYAASKTEDSIFIGLDGNCVGALRETPAGCVDPDCDPYLTTWIWTNIIQNGTNTINVTTAGTHTINVWIRDVNHRLDGIYITQGSETPADASHGIELNPADCTIGIFSGDAVSAQSVDTTGWTNGTKYLTVNGYDTACLTLLPASEDSFEFDSTPTLQDSIVISDNTAIATSSPTELDLGVVMQRFRADSNNVADGQIELMLLTLADDGSATSISDVKVYISSASSSALPPDAVLIGNAGIWDGALKTIMLTGGTASDRTVINGFPKYIYIVYDISPAQSGKTIQSRVSSISVETPDIGAANIGASNLLTISDCVQTGSISILPGQTLYGNQIDLTSIVNAENATGVYYDVSVVSSGVCVIDPEGTYIEAEDFTGTIPQGTGTFVLETSQAGYLGTGYLRSNGGTSQTKNACPSLDEGKQYQVKFNQTGTYYVWMRGYAVDGLADSVFIGLDGNCVGALNENNVFNQWVWSKTKQSLSGQTNETNTINVTTPGIHTINIWIRDKNHLIDGIYITQGTEAPTNAVHGIEVNPNYCPVTVFSGDAAQAQSVNTTIWTEGTKALIVTGNDATCLDQLTSAADTFTFDPNYRPTSTIADPVNGALLNDSSPNPYLITGTAGDEENVNHIEISTDGGQTWEVASCPGCPGANPAWSYSWTLPANGNYTIKSKAVDNMSAYEVPGPGVNVAINRGGPSVSSTNPLNGATAIVADSTVTVNWDRDIDCSTVTTASVNISPAPASWTKTSCSGSQAVFTPGGQSSLTSYTIDVTTDVKDSVGNSMASPYQFSYTTGEPTPPSSVITDPSDGSKINSSAPNPYIINGTANDNDKVQGVKVRINGGAWMAVTTCTGCSTDSATWTYSWDLPVDGSYSIESQATDASNNEETPAAPITVEVDRTSPSVSGTNPPTGAIGVQKDLQVSITWNDNINCSTVNTSTIISDNPNWALFGCGGNTAFFTTAGQADFTLYTVTVKSGPAGVKSSSDVEMSDDYVFTYRTNQAPSLTIHEPSGNDSVKAGETFNITFTFNDPDHNPTVNFYYDTDTDMAGGSPIPGACTGAVEGINAVCAWNIDAGMTAGNYHVYGVTNDGHGEVKALSGMLTIYPPNQLPVLSISEPNGNDDTVVDGDNYSITYTLTDANADDTITVDFFYDTDNQNYNGIPITGPCSSAPEGTGVTCGWNTLGLSPGTYYIYGITSGDIGGPVQTYSSGPITINTSNTIPTLSIHQPDGVDDTIIEGYNYAITYTLSDIDDVVTVAFYYDNDNLGLNGTSLAGACATAPEGTGATCIWDTTGMSAGTYYIYGITSGDRDSTIVARYSLGMVTINVNAPAVSSTAPDNGTTAIAPDSAVTIIWDENVNCATVTTSSVTMLPAPTSWTKTSCSGNQAVFTPDGQNDTTLYQVTVTTAVQDLDGNGMTTAHVFSYTTNNPPALNISVPDGSEDPQTAGNSFNIEYTLTDNDHEVTAALYYDTDSDMTGGQPILGCGAVIKGTNLTCAWTDIPAGTYYIYGVSDDGIGGGGNTCTSRTWSGSNTSYLTGTNWTPSGAPQDGDDVIFDGTSSINSLWDTNVSLTSLSVNVGYAGTVTIDSSVAVSGDLVISDGSIVIGSGDITVGSAPVSCGSSSSSDVAGLVTILPAGITVTPTSGLVTTEAGGSDTFTIVLNSQPTANVTIGLSSSDLTEGTVAPASLTFTSADWNVAQTVTVTGVDDSLIDGNVVYSIITAPASSADAYNGVNADDVSVVTNNDDDVATIILTPASGLVTNEGGGTDTFTVALSSQPAEDVTIGLSSSDLSEGTVDPASVTFTSTNWVTPQTVTVTGVNDSVADGNTGYSILTAPAVSADPQFNGVNAADVSATNNDNDTAAINVTPTSGLITDENGGTDTFTIALNSEPTENVTIGLSSSNTAEGTVSQASLTFTSANWSTPQIVTVTGADDLAADGSTGYSIITAAAVSADSGYSGMDAANVTVTNNDNEIVGITVTPTSGLITDESGGTATFTVVLTGPPAADVTIGISSSSTAEGTVAPAGLTFTSANWYTAQTVTVTGVNDSVQDGNIAYNILTAAAVSGDPAYSGLDASDVSVTNTDNDVAGITVSPLSIITTESGGVASFWFKLNSQPTADVTIGISSNDTSEGTVSISSWTFTSVNWNTKKYVTVTGVNDNAADGNITFNILTAAATSGDGNYSGMNASDVSVTNYDNDAVGVTVTPTSGLVTTEAGGAVSFTVVLNSEPASDVTIGVSSSNAAEGAVSPASLIFTSVNWNSAQTVIVTGVNDSVQDGNIAYTIVTAAAVSTDAYNGFNPDDVSVTNNDDGDTADITVSAISGSTTEAGGTATFTVVLNSQPTANVTIGLSSGDLTEGTVSAASVVFTSANWNVPQTVTVAGVDDSVQDGNQSFSITTAQATSTDGNYSVINPADVSVTNNDNDVAGVSVSAISGSTTEAGGTATFTVVLNSQPTADVTIGVSSGDLTEGTVSAASLTFTSANWNVPQTVTVTGVDDNVQDGNQAFSIITAQATSTDGNYNVINPDDVSVTNNDDDVAGVTVSAISGSTTEAGGTATFTVVLNSEPTADVTIGLSSGNLAEGTVSTASVTFTTVNWNTAQTVTVTGVNDDVQDGNQAFSIITAQATSTDTNYNVINPADVSVTNNDDDEAGVTVSAISGSTTEAGGTATFTVVLNSEPTADVTIGISSNDTSEGTVSTASVTFTTVNWNTAQTVTVTGVNDDAADGNITFNILTAAAVSGDGNYSGKDADDASVTNYDNDAVGVTVTPTFGLITDENSGTATFTVVLDSEPASIVTIGISSNDTTEGTVSPSSLIFTAGDWNIPQTVIVTGVDDSIQDGNISYTIVTAPAVSTDAYNGFNPDDVSVTNNDDGDTAGITVGTIIGSTTEAGGTATFTVVLDSQPTADVTIGLSSSNTAEGTVSPASLIFTSGNWNVAQTVTVTGVNDDVQDGNQAFSIITAQATSTDTNYNVINPDDVSVTNNDDDVAGVTVSAISGSTTEAGGTATFTVVLDSQPTADVTIGLSSGNLAEGTVSTASVTFTTVNWNTAQTVTVTGVNDDVQDGNQAFSIITAQATSTDTNYNVINPDDVSVTNNDDDVAGVTVSAISGSTTEAGGTATFTVVLDSQPTADVTIGLSSGNPAEGTVSPVSLIFTSGDWNIAQTVTVTGVDDDVQDGNQAFSIITAQATSTDDNYNVINPDDVSVTNNDDDVAGVTVSAISGSTTEAGGTATFTVVLNSEPTADVTIGLSSGNLAEGTVSTASVTFTTANWNTAQTVTVTGVDDNVQDGNQAFSIITAQATSTDGNYNVINPDDVSVTNNDDDVAGVTVSAISGSTTEAGGTATFTVVLNSEPTADVTIGLSSGNLAEGTVSTASVTFTTVNWNTAQTVTVTGVDEFIDDGNQPFSIITAQATSTDSNYNVINPADVSVTNTDNDTAGIYVDPASGLNTSENGTQAFFSVTLESQPTGNVTITLSSNNTDEGIITDPSPATLTFTPANWDEAQWLTVDGVADGVVDDNILYQIITAPATSEDTNYNLMNAVDVSVTNWNMN